MSVLAQHRAICPECGEFILPGTPIDKGPLGWKHTECPEDDIPNIDDRLRCRWCGDVLTPDYECENCEQVG